MKGTIEFHEEDMKDLNKDSGRYDNLKKIVDYLKPQVEEDTKNIKNLENNLRTLLGVVNQETIIASS